MNTWKVVMRRDGADDEYMLIQSNSCTMWNDYTLRVDGISIMLNYPIDSITIVTG